MSIETRITGDPDTVARAARWLDDDLHRAVDRAADTLRDARPRGGWEGLSADGFSRWAETSAATTDKVARRIDRAGRELASYATALRRAQADMQKIRAAARTAGLRVDGYVVVDPGPGPADPGRLPAATPGLKIPLTAVAAHAEAVAAFEAHGDLVRAYRAAEEDAQEVRDDLAEAVDVLQTGYDALRSLGWLTHGLGILTGAFEVGGGVQAFGSGEQVGQVTGTAVARPAQGVQVGEVVGTAAGAAAVPPDRIG